ncbi:hypothetical protein [Streptomyces sp. NPDC058751]|uniref:hypothetical protein n=1 Tax=Streptomyces sp. NPDC058751 TaxID=3346623 RepID=UPI0036AF2338
MATWIKETWPRPLPADSESLELVEQTFALLHQVKRLAVRWERRTELQDAFVSLACGLICWRRLKKRRS